MQGLHRVRIQNRTYRVFGVSSQRPSTDSPLVPVPTSAQVEKHWPVDRTHHPALVGKPSQTLHGIPSGMGTQVPIPNQASTETTAAPTKAGQQTGIDQAVLRRQPTAFTHFISLPLKCPQLQGRFQDFRTQAQALYPAHLDLSPGVRVDPSPRARLFLSPRGHPNLFITPTRLHLTLALLNLDTPVNLARACDTLQHCSAELNDLLGARPLVLYARGLQLMRGTPDACQVLCAGIQDDSDRRLLQVSQLLLTAFRAAGLIASDDVSRLKLHMTLLNTTFVRRSSLAPADKRRALAFDAQPILRHLHGFDFGAVRVACVQLAKKGSVDKRDGSYASECDILLP
ncbi:activating signal cointegrator 1 complex subunit [Dimargaris verticillata]|uniref:Activating signal cointegrator 1 complex subunit n=1 Tax=Dimargaris verticillata TaxID=2761393 RepID=A0A9W8B6R2_9FUNG|nr:activating signal cointegrator 1 complex subunit [Dimargaris verticillata]